MTGRSLSASVPLLGSDILIYLRNFFIWHIFFSISRQPVQSSFCHAPWHQSTTVPISVCSLSGFRHAWHSVSARTTCLVDICCHWNNGGGGGWLDGDVSTVVWVHPGAGRLCLRGPPEQRQRGQAGSVSVVASGVRASTEERKRVEGQGVGLFPPRSIQRALQNSGK